VIRIALIGDYDSSVTAHRAIPEALKLAADEDRTTVESLWLHTSTLHAPEFQLAGFAGIWCVPASPYANMQGALDCIRYARECAIPFLGTCGGFQHALIEYARNACGLRQAAHAETDPDAADAVIAPLACALVDQAGEIILREGSRLRHAYGCERIQEEYRCSFGVNPKYAQLLFRDPLRATAHDTLGEVRGMELSGDAFFVCTLFQPERRALRGEVPPVVRAFFRASRSRFLSLSDKPAFF
jgi:CTP synthase (UTP-ammonia lyase)